MVGGLWPFRLEVWPESQFARLLALSNRRIIVAFAVMMCRAAHAVHFLSALYNQAVRQKVMDWVEAFAGNEFPRMNGVIVECLQEYETQPVSESAV